MKYTKEQKQKYFKDLRARWKESKALADKDEVVKALHREVSGDFSYYSFYFTLMEMRKLKYDGIPYVDCKTFNGWKCAGFQVRKGEKSKLSGITWIGSDPDPDKDGKDKFVYPKMYKLFHKSQVEKIKN